MSFKRIINKLARKPVHTHHEQQRQEEPKHSFSQCGEDLIIRYIFMLRGISNPSYMDIGAHDPFYLNNTAIFYTRGSRGINIDANGSLIEKFRRQRPDDQNLNIGIGPVEREMDFYILSDSALSTFSKREADKIVSYGKYSLVETKKVKVMTIDKIIELYTNGSFPDFLSLDVEGLDFEILYNINFEKHSPKVICVEAAEYSPIGAGKRKTELIEFLNSKGFYEYANTNLNAIMVKKDFWFI